MNLSLEIDPRSYLAAGDKFVSALASSSEQILRSVAGAAVVEMAAVTPPGSLGVRGWSAVTLGEQTLKLDAWSVVNPIAGATSPEPVERIIQRHRRKDGRVRVPDKRIVVSSSDFARYLRKALPRVGYTAGGWKAAADALGRDLPGYMTDVPGPGSISITTSEGFVSIEVRNEVPWFGDMVGVPARMKFILDKYEAPLREYLERGFLEARSRAGLS